MLRGFAKRFNDLTNKMVSGEQLSPSDASFYELIEDVESLLEKCAYLQQLMKEHVAEGKLTGLEIKRLKQSITEKLAKNDSEKLKARLQHIEGLSPHAGAPVKNHTELAALYKEMVAFEKEKLSLKESYAKAELEERIAALEADVANWFESPEAVQERLDWVRKRGRSAGMRKKRATGGGKSNKSKSKSKGGRRR